MFKRLFADDHGHGVGLLAAGNLALNPLEKFLSTASPILSTLLVAGQVAVAVLTAVYIFKKIRALDRPKKKKK
jgi:hypothetical protein